MLKFKESKESVASDLLLWQSRPTQVSIKDTYELKIHPVTSIFDAITFEYARLRICFSAP